MFIQKIKGNVKVGADTAIGEKTIVVGPNGSGKSTLVNIVELALTSRAGDIAGRTDIAREADVMALVRSGEKTLYAEVTFDDGETASYTTEGSTAKAKKAVAIRPSSTAHDEVLPIRALREAVLGSPATARKYLMGKVGGGTMADVEALIAEPLRPTFKLAANRFAGLPVSDALVGIIDYAGKQSREATATAKASREAAKLVSGGRAAPPTDTEVKAAKASFDAARESLMAAQVYENLESEITKVEDEILRVEAKANDIAAALHNAKAHLNAATRPTPLPEIVQHVYPVMVESGKVGECLCCGGTAPAKDLVQSVEEAIRATEASEYESLESAVKTLSATATDVLSKLDALEARVVELKGKRGKPVDIAKLSKEYDAAEYKVADLRAAKNAWETVQKAESAALDADRQAAEWKSLKEAAEVAMGLTLDRALSGFIEKVQGYLPKTDTFDLRLRDGDREVVQFGLVRDGVLHTALSGAEWARVTAAMASACVPEGQYACIIPEERAFDAVTLKGVLVALSDCPHQVILTSPVAPKSVPAGWTLIRRGE